jgi:hypothetical protein
VEPGPGDQIVATYQFSASSSETGGTVNVSGRFVAVPGPLSTENLWNGCETLLLPAEDNEAMPIQPANYPPGFDGEPFPWPPIVFWPCIPDWDNPTITEVVGWHRVRVEADGTEVWQRTVKKTPDVLLPAFPPGVDALEAPCNPRTEPEERRLPPPGPDQSPCIPGPMSDWPLEVIRDWYETTADDGRPVWRRRVKWHPTIEVPARNGGDESDCQPYEDEEDIDIPPDPDEDSDCVPGPRSEWQVSVWLDWYEEESAGETVVVRVLEIVPTVLRPPRGNGSWLPCRTRYVTEERAVGEEGTSISVPGDDVPGGGTVSRPPGTPEPGGGETLEIRGPMVLDFLEEGQADLQSPPQPVAGSASLTEIAVTGGSFALDLNQSSADVNACSSNMGIRMAVQMIAGQGAFAGDIVLSASAGQLILNLTFSEGTIAVQAPVTLTPLPTGLRGNVSDGRLELRPNGQGNYSCSANTMDFAFTLTQAP